MLRYYDKNVRIVQFHLRRHHPPKKFHAGISLLNCLLYHWNIYAAVLHLFLIISCKFSCNLMVTWNYLALKRVHCGFACQYRLKWVFSTKSSWFLYVILKQLHITLRRWKFLILLPFYALPQRVVWKSLKGFQFVMFMMG